MSPPGASHGRYERLGAVGTFSLSISRATLVGAPRRRRATRALWPSPASTSARTSLSAPPAPRPCPRLAPPCPRSLQRRAPTPHPWRHRALRHCGRPSAPPAPARPRSTVDQGRSPGPHPRCGPTNRRPPRGHQIGHPRCPLLVLRKSPCGFLKSTRTPL